MATVSFRNATSTQGNPLTTQTLTLPTILAGDLVVLYVAWNQTAAITLSGAGTFTHQGTDSTIAAQLQCACYTAISTDGSESGATLNINVGSQEKLAAVAASYSGVNLGSPFGNSTPTYAQFTTSSTTSATTPTVSPVPASMVLSLYTSKSSTNTTYTTPAGLSSRQQVFGTGAGAIDMALFDTNGTVSSGGNQTSTMGTATANKIASTLVLVTALAKPLRINQAVNRSAVW